mmetsp:Transcript_15918/g.34575  ORF Transcript_15918/g.34575 Transcript_15918/m.34575 type:complete len:360 (+) Transcript_15918:253-1332(+)
MPPRFDEHDDPTDFNPDHDVDFHDTRARHRDLVLRLKGAQGGSSRDRPWRSETAPPPTPAVENMRSQQVTRSAPPVTVTPERTFLRPSELRDEPLPTVDQIRASMPVRPIHQGSASSRSSPPSRIANKARASNGGKNDDSLAEIRRSHREVEEDFAERRLRVAREERAARAVERKADEAERRRSAGGRRAAEEEARRIRAREKDVRNESKLRAERKEEKERRRIQIEAAAEARRRKEREEEEEAMRIWNELRMKEKENAKEMEQRAANEGKNKSVRFNRNTVTSNPSFDTLNTMSTMGTTNSSFDVNFWLPSCGDFADVADNGCAAAGCADGWLDNLFGDNSSKKKEGEKTLSSVPVTE